MYWACHPFYSPIFWWSHQPNHPFSVSSHQNVLYNSVAISILYPQSQLKYTAHLGDMNQKNWWFEFGDLVGDSNKKKWWVEWTAHLAEITEHTFDNLTAWSMKALSAFFQSVTEQCNWHTMYYLSVTLFICHVLTPSCSMQSNYVLKSMGIHILLINKVWTSLLNKVEIVKLC